MQCSLKSASEEPRKFFFANDIGTRVTILGRLSDGRPHLSAHSFRGWPS